jgi:hypothetical protein
MEDFNLRNGIDSNAPVGSFVEQSEPKGKLKKKPNKIIIYYILTPTQTRN